MKNQTEQIDMLHSDKLWIGQHDINLSATPEYLPTSTLTPRHTCPIYTDL